MMTDRKSVLKYCLALPDTYQDAPFHDENWQLVRYRKNKKAFAWTYEWEDGTVRVNVKVDPQWRDFWRQTYPSVIPGYHQNKEHWNTVILDGSIPDKDIKRMLMESYDLVTGITRTKHKKKV
jgi:predicted DNA-binding protein (MmcQ/YjbR family)